MPTFAIFSGQPPRRESLAFCSIATNLWVDLFHEICLPILVNAERAVR